MNILCKLIRHRWQEKECFQGGMYGVTGFECERCGERKVEADPISTQHARNEAYRWRDGTPRPAQRTLELMKGGKS